MSVPKYNPWVGGAHNDPRAYRAYCAYPSPTLGTIGTIGTGSQREPQDSNPRIAGWCVKLYAARSKLSRKATNRFHIDTALELCRTPWLLRLEALGWKEDAIFAYNTADCERGGLIQALTGHRLAAATQAAAYLVTTNGQLRCVRAQRAVHHLPMLWEVAGRPNPAQLRPGITLHVQRTA